MESDVLKYQLQISQINSLENKFKLVTNLQVKEKKIISKKKNCS